MKKNSGIITLIAAAIILAFNSGVLAAKTLKIAVLDFQANDTSKYSAKAVSEFISTELAQKKELTIIERSQMGAILDEQGFQQTGCTDQSCAVEMGKLLSANKIILGTLSKTGNIFVITAKVIDVETGKIDYAETEKCTKEDDLELASRIIAVKLVNKIAGTSYSIPLRTYQTDEERNRFSINILYQYSMTFGVKIPYVKLNDTATDVHYIEAEELDINTQTVIISSGYEFTQNIGLRLDFGFDVKTVIPEHDEEKQISGYFDRFQSFYSMDAYSLYLTPEYIFPVSGFNFIIAMGIGYHNKKFNTKGDTHYSISTLTPDYNTTCYYYEVNIPEQHTMSIKCELGLSVYISRYMELQIYAGINKPILSNFINDAEIQFTETRTEGTPPALSTEFENDFEGNAPLTYYANAGIAIRLF